MSIESEPFTDRQEAFRGLMVFLIALIGSIFFGALINTLFYQMMGIESQQDASVADLRISLLILHFFSFLFPALLFGWMAYKAQMFAFFKLNSSLPVTWVILGFVMLLLLTPVIQYTYELNQQFPLPSWMSSMENDANSTLTRLLKMDSFSTLLITILLVAVLPALGEELLFRGIIQQYGYKMFRNPEVSVWVTAAIFSAIHFQFEGFIPRFVLGLFLGYLFYWTKNLLLPIIVHFLNNAGMTMLAYNMPEESLNLDDPAMPDIPLFALVLAILLLIPAVQYFRKLSHPDDDKSDA